MNNNTEQLYINKVLANIHTDLAFLVDSGVLSESAFDEISAKIPRRYKQSRDISARNSVASLQAKLDSQLGFSNEVKPSKQPSITATPTSSPAPPAYAGIAQAEAMYAYTATDQGDLALVPGDKITIIEYINSDWWKGSCNGREGIFPANYVLKLDSQKEKFGTPAPYGNPVYPQPAPVPQEEENKLGKYGKRYGGKFTDAAVFGAGATAGSHLISSIF